MDYNYQAISQDGGAIEITFHRGHSNRSTRTNSTYTGELHPAMSCANEAVQVAVDLRCRGLYSAFLIEGALDELAADPHLDGVARLIPEEYVG